MRSEAYAPRQLRENNSVSVSTKTIPAPPPGFVVVIDGFTLRREAGGASTRLSFLFRGTLAGIFHRMYYDHAAVTGFANDSQELDILCLPSVAPFLPLAEGVEATMDTGGDVVSLSYTVQWHYEPYAYVTP